MSAAAAPSFAVPVSGDGAGVLAGIEAAASPDSTVGGKVRGQRPAASGRSAAEGDVLEPYDECS